MSKCDAYVNMADVSTVLGGSSLLKPTPTPTLFSLIKCYAVRIRPSYLKRLTQRGFIAVYCASMNQNVEDCRWLPRMLRAVRRTSYQESILNCHKNRLRAVWNDRGFPGRFSPRSFRALPRS